MSQKNTQNNNVVTFINVKQINEKQNYLEFCNTLESLGYKEALSLLI